MSSSVTRPCRDAVLVHDESEVVLPLQEGGELVLEAGGLGNEPGRFAQEGARMSSSSILPSSVGDRLQQVLHVEDADHVLGLFEDRAAGAAVLAGQGQRPPLSRAVRSAVHGHRHRACRWTITSETFHLTEVEHPAQHVAVAGLHQAFGVVVLDRAADLLVGGQHVGLRRPA
jgi:hypothetical protein